MPEKRRPRGLRFDRRVFPWGLGLLGIMGALLVSAPRAHPQVHPLGWRPEEAARYLDGRMEEWNAFPGSRRGQGKTESRCVSCHTVLPYALARPALRRRLGAPPPGGLETGLVAQTNARTEHWESLDTEPYGLFYDSSDRKKKESRGTEAVLLALILALDDQAQGRAGPSEGTRRAFENLWRTQAASGEEEGSWDWLDFHMGPWEEKEARYLGAALAAIALGTAPGTSSPGGDPVLEAGARRLKSYLGSRFPKENLHHQAWGLWAAAKVDGILTEDQKRDFMDRLLKTQEPDGGFSLPRLGSWVRSDGTPQETGSDGYATGLVLHVLQTAGMSAAHPALARGLVWLAEHQERTGAWRGISVNKKRDPASHPGKFMSDAATGLAVLALSH